MHGEYTEPVLVTQGSKVHLKVLFGWSNFKIQKKKLSNKNLSLLGHSSKKDRSNSYDQVIIQECSASHNWNIGTVFRELARWNIFQPFSLKSTPKENFQGGVEGSKRGSCRVEPERRGTEPSLLSCLHLTNLGRVRLSCFNNAEEQSDCLNHADDQSGQIVTNISQSASNWERVRFSCFNNAEEQSDWQIVYSASIEGQVRFSKLLVTGNFQSVRYCMDNPASSTKQTEQQRGLKMLQLMQASRGQEQCGPISVLLNWSSQYSN